MIIMKMLLTVLLMTSLLSISAQRVYADIVNSKHNLSVSGPGTVKAQSETRVCVFCHTPHNAVPAAPLWNRNDSGSSYTPYTSSTAVASPGQPTGSSILCLSCHDGTIALGDVISESALIAMAGGLNAMPAGPGRLGTDLSDDHPISFVYSSVLASTRGELADPATLTGDVKLDAGGQLQCSSCHDAHNDANGKFLVVDNTGGALCTSCHQKPHWNGSSHATASASANVACLGCHQPHTAGGRQRLLKFAAEEDNCTSCHDGSITNKNIAGDINKISNHPVSATTGVHSPDESVLVNNRHVECIDCHNPHAAKATGGTPSGPLAEVAGIDQSGLAILPLTNEYELCFRCHGDSTGKPAPLTPRQITQTNVRLEFNTSNPSFHPVAGPGTNSNVPGLIAPLTEASTIRCSDCHAGNTTGGAAGPHGSDFSPILKLPYSRVDNTPESASAYALCYSCHDRTTLLDDNQGFSKHTRHVVNVGASCSTCHDPHGISSTQGNTTNNTHLINFDTSIVLPNRSNELFYLDEGNQRGECSLSCHGRDHRNRGY